MNLRFGRVRRRLGPGFCNDAKQLGRERRFRVRSDAIGSPDDGEAAPVSTPWKAGPCWRVQEALDEEGIDYQAVKGSVRPGKRDELRRISGQRLYPVIQFEDGSIYREESVAMAATIRAGKLDAKRASA